MSICFEFKTSQFQIRPEHERHTFLAEAFPVVAHLHALYPAERQIEAGRVEEPVAYYMDVVVHTYRTVQNVHEFTIAEEIAGQGVADA